MKYLKWLLGYRVCKDCQTLKPSCVIVEGWICLDCSELLVERMRHELEWVKLAWQVALDEKIQDGGIQ